MFDISKNFIGNKEIYHNIRINFLNKALSHSIILFGDRGIGKSTFVYFLTNQIFNNFTEDSHKKLESNHNNLIYNNSHPNFKIVKKEIDAKTKKIKNYITIDQIRNLEKFVYHSSSLLLPKIILIDNVDQLNKNAANGLLKILEEPKKNTFFFLISNQLSSLLPTIRSRCIKFKLKKPSFDEFKQIILNTNGNINENDIKFLFDISNGSPGIALELYSEDIQDTYNSILNIFKEKNLLSKSIINLSNILSSQTDEQFKSFLSIIKFILTSIIKINLGCEIKQLFISNIIYTLNDLSIYLDNKSCIKVLDYLNLHENNLFIFNLDKKLFTLNLFSEISITK